GTCAPFCPSYSSVHRPPPRATLFPYTTLFRSHAERLRDVVVRAHTQAANLVGLFAARGEDEDRHPAPLVPQRAEHAVAVQPRQRSEEHTSELQSRFDLVCRLLLEKKKITILHR